MAIFGQLTKTPVGSSPTSGDPSSARKLGGSDEESKDMWSKSSDKHSLTESSMGHVTRNAGLAPAAAFAGLQGPFVEHGGVDKQADFSIMTSPTRQRDFSDFD